VSVAGDGAGENTGWPVVARKMDGTEAAKAFTASRLLTLG
jgi:hypothetical protein